MSPKHKATSADDAAQTPPPERFKGRASILGPIKYTRGRGSVPWSAQPLLVEGPIADIGQSGNGGLSIEIRGKDGKDYEVTLDAETCRAIARVVENGLTAA